MTCDLRFVQVYVLPKIYAQVRPCRRGVSHVARLNFKTSRVGVYKCLSLIVGFAVTVAIWPREVVSCRDFILRAVATFWAMSLVGIYPGRASHMHNLDIHQAQKTAEKIEVSKSLSDNNKQNTTDWGGHGLIQVSIYQPLNQLLQVMNK